MIKTTSWKPFGFMIIKKEWIFNDPFLRILDFFQNYKATVIDTWKNYTEILGQDKLKFMEQIEENRIEEIFYENIKVSGVKNLNIIKDHSSIALYDLIEKDEKFKLQNFN